MMAASIPDPCNPAQSVRYAPKRHLTPQKFEDLCFLHEMEEGDRAVSRSTLRRCWDARWQHFLVIRNVGQGKRCRVCAIGSEQRAQATTIDEMAALTARIQQHIDVVMADRNHSTRGNHMSERDSKVESPDGLGLMGKLVIDGMDQAKFRCPRNLASSAEFESLWRPQLHVTGAIIVCFSVRLLD